MFRWVPYPFLRFTPALIVGILVGLYCSVAISPGAATGVILAYGTLVTVLPAQWQRRLSITTGLLALAAIALVGVARVNQYNEARQTHHLLHYSPEYSHYVATVTSAPERRRNSWRVTARLRHVLQQDSAGLHPSPPLTAQLLIYQPKADSLQLLAYGDRILVRGVPQRIAPPANPDAFDQQRYWASQQTFHQQYLRTDQWQRLGHEPANYISSLAMRLRQRSQALLTEAVVDSEARSIALALVLGIKDQLDDRVREAYGRAGAMHVLAVSGLHIGIVYGVLAFLLMPLKRVRWGKFLHALVCIAVLWLFALVTGGSVSVMRAATMFTCVIVADATQRRSNIFNTLALSAFLLLLINPYYILSVGFQLSYLAVLGIVYLQPRIYGWFTCRYWLADKIWALTAVSIAAQLATLPISLYYFHQFPTYFWLANIIVIPAAFVILSLGLLTLGVGAVVPPLLTGLGGILELVIRGVNTAIYSLEYLPLSYVDRLYVDLPQVTGLYGGVIAFLLLFHYRQLRYLGYACGCIAAVTTLRLHRTWVQSQQRAVTFYQVRGQSPVDFTLGATNYHWGRWDEQSAYQIDPHFLRAGFTTTVLDTITASPVIPIAQRGGITLAVWQGKRIAFVQTLPKLPNPLPNKLVVDYLVVRNNAIRQLTAANQLFSYGTLVIDSSNRSYRAQQLVAQAEASGIAYHCVPTQGAFQVTVP